MMNESGPRLLFSPPSAALSAAAFVLLMGSAADGQTKTIQVELKLRTGGALSGLVVEQTDHGLVMVSDKTPYVFAWNEVESGSAYVARRKMVALQRGGKKSLTAEDHFQLGLFTLKFGRNDLAAMEFRRATELDDALKPRVREAFARFRRGRDTSKKEHDPFDQERHGESPGQSPRTPEPGPTFATLSDTVASTVSNDPAGDLRGRVLKVYRSFGRKVEEVLGKEVVLIETDHFLIWTDWEPRYRDRIGRWCEAMYAALCRQFNIDPAEDIFLAKCPVFCWRAKSRFRRFARLFDGYAGTDAVGYTRSIESNGHVHVVLLRRGLSEHDLDRFACTLVHEGTHAFVHRLYTTRLIPHWVNEGLAELVAQRILGDRCNSAPNAALLAGAYVRYNWPITDLLHGIGPIGVEQYPLAYSLVAYLMDHNDPLSEELGRERFAGFVRSLKEGHTVAHALAARYDGLTLEQLEADWRSAILAVQTAQEGTGKDDLCGVSHPCHSDAKDGKRIHMEPTPSPTLPAPGWGTRSLPAPRQTEGPWFNVRSEVPGMTYRNVCGSSGQLPILEQNGQGIGIIDYDNDGLLDLFVPNGSTEGRWRRNDNPGCRLFKNLGGWRFLDVTDKAGVRGGAWSCGVAVADYDADGDFDTYVLNWGPNVLYRNNGDGTFTDVTLSAGVGDPRWSSSAAFADFNGDGLLDLYVSNYVHFDYDSYPTKEKDGGPCLYRGVETGCGPWCYEGQRDTLYINAGGRRFEDRSETGGLACTKGFRGFGVVAGDLDEDGDVDVYVGCDVMENLYLENLGGAKFVSVGRGKGGARNGAGAHESGMGVAVADFDLSGTLDLMVTNFSGETNTFYRNADGFLSDATAAIGFDLHPIEMGWGVCARDFNQDGRVDVFVANGHIYPQVARLGDPKDSYAQAPRLCFQNPGGRLEEVPADKAFGRPVSLRLRGLATGDLDNDGDVDIVAVQHNGPLVFFENLSNRPALTVELVDAHGGRSPMGARVRTYGGPWRRMLPNQGYQSSHDHRLYFPLPPDTTKALLEVGWPDGAYQRYQVEPRGAGNVRLHQRAGKSPR